MSPMQKLSIWAAGMALATVAACASQQTEEAHPTISKASKAAQAGVYIGPASFLVVGDHIEEEAQVRCSFTPDGELKSAVFEISKLEVTDLRQKQAEQLCQNEYKGFAKPR